MAAKKTEFIVDDKKYTPRTAIVNGKVSRIWTRRRLISGGWVHEGVAFVRASASKAEVLATVDGKLDG